MRRLSITAYLLLVIGFSIEFYEISEISREEYQEVQHLVLDSPELISIIDEIYKNKPYISRRDFRNLRKASQCH